MRPSKRAQRQSEKASEGLKEFLLAMGQDPDAVDKAFDSMPVHSDEKLLQAEGVLLHLIKPTRFISKTCKRKECGEVFGTSYRAVAYCSDNCRAKDLEAQTGIRWNHHTDRYQNLGAERPLVIGPAAYKALVEFAEYILGQNQIQIEESILPEQSPQTPPQSLEEQFATLMNGVSELENQSTDVVQTTPEEPLPQLNGFSHLDPNDPFGF